MWTSSSHKFTIQHMMGYTGAVYSCYTSQLSQSSAALFVITDRKLTRCRASELVILSCHVMFIHCSASAAIETATPLFFHAL